MNLGTGKARYEFLPAFRFPRLARADELIPQTAHAGVPLRLRQRRVVLFRTCLPNRGPQSAGTHFLRDGLHTWNVLQLGGAIAALSKLLCRDAEFRAFLYKRLSDKRPLIVMGAIDALRFRRDHKALERASTLLRHRSPYVRAAVLRYLRRHNSLNVFPILVKALHDRSHIVRRRLPTASMNWERRKPYLICHRYSLTAIRTFARQWKQQWKICEIIIE